VKRKLPINEKLQANDVDYGCTGVEQVDILIYIFLAATAKGCGMP